MPIFHTPKTAESKVVHVSFTEIGTARLTGTLSPTGDVQYQMCTDGGATPEHWEDVTSGTDHTFTTTGKRLKWRAVGVYPTRLASIIINVGNETYLSFQNAIKYRINRIGSSEVRVNQVVLRVKYNSG